MLAHVLSRMLASVPRFYEAMSHLQTNYGCHRFTTDLHVTLPFASLFFQVLFVSRSDCSSAVVCCQYYIMYSPKVSKWGGRAHIWPCFFFTKANRRNQLLGKRLRLVRSLEYESTNRYTKVLPRTLLITASRKGKKSGGRSKTKWGK